MNYLLNRVNWLKKYQENNLIKEQRRVLFILKYHVGFDFVLYGTWNGRFLNSLMRKKLFMGH